MLLSLLLWNTWDMDMYSFLFLFFHFNSHIFLFYISNVHLTYDLTYHFAFHFTCEPYVQLRFYIHIIYMHFMFNSYFFIFRYICILVYISCINHIYISYFIHITYMNSGSHFLSCLHIQMQSYTNFSFKFTMHTCI